MQKNIKCMEKEGNKRVNKRGQTTLFIIIAIVVVALGVLIYMYYPEIKSGLGFGEKNPQIFIEQCLKEDIMKDIDTLSLQGGAISPEHYIVYNGENIDYLCYTNEYYKTCVVQEPMLKKHVEDEIENAIDVKARECFDELKKNYEESGYTVNLKSGSANVELLPKRIITSFNYSMAVSKEGESQTYDKFSVIIYNNLYELTSIANSIIEWETRYGEAETTVYMTYYRDLKVEKKKQIEGSTIYILTDTNTGNKFQFASRSVSWPPGYGF